MNEVEKSNKFKCCKRLIVKNCKHAEYQDQFGEHMYDESGNYIGPEYVPEEKPEAPPAPAVAEPAHSIGGDTDEPSLLPIEGVLLSDDAPETEAAAPAEAEASVPAAAEPEATPAAEAPGAKAEATAESPEATA